jgi:hypothetical protein
MPPIEFGRQAIPHILISILISHLSSRKKSEDFVLLKYTGLFFLFNREGENVSEYSVL